MDWWPWDFSASFTKGQLLCIELEHRTYYGNFHGRSKDNSRLELIDVRDHKDATGSKKRTLFYHTEILAIKSDQAPPDNETTVRSQTPPPPVELKKPSLPANSIQNYTYISEFRGRYHVAIADLQGHDFVGVSLEEDTLLTLATSQQIYIFDMLQLGRLRADLTAILEAPSPLKIVHNDAHMRHQLLHKYGCRVHPVFDTQTAHSLVTGTDDAISVERCLGHYFSIDLPEVDVDLANGVTSEDQLLAIARRVAFLIKLYDQLVHENLLKRMTATCHKYVTSLSMNDNRMEAGYEIVCGKNVAIESIEDFV